MPATDRWYQDLLVCPDCRSSFVAVGDGLGCARCGREIALTPAPIDLRPAARSTVRLEVPRYAPALSALDTLDLSTPQFATRSPGGERDSRALFAGLAAAGAHGGDLLDLGCGPRDQAEIAAAAGFRYLGADLDNPAADLLADAHALPFADGSFDVVFAYAVLEHLHDPFVAVAEVRRLLRPGGWFVGTVSQGEPFHGSFCHLTPWGLLAVLASVELAPQRLWPAYDTLRGLAQMGRYSRPTRALLRAVDLFDRATPFFSPRRFLSWTPHRDRLERLYRAASLCFVARA